MHNISRMTSTPWEVVGNYFCTKISRHRTKVTIMCWLQNDERCPFAKIFYEAWRNISYLNYLPTLAYISKCQHMYIIIFWVVVVSVKVASKVCASRLITKHFYVQELSYGKLNNDKKYGFCQHCQWSQG